MGSEQDFLRAVEPHLETLLRVASHLTGDQETAELLVRTVLVRAHQLAPTTRAPADRDEQLAWLVVLLVDTWGDNHPAERASDRQPGS